MRTIIRPNRKSEHVVVHMTPDDKASIVSAASGCGVTVSDFCRQAVLSVVTSNSQEA